MCTLLSESKDPPCNVQQSIFFSEHRELQATAMSVDWSGQLVLLAGRFVDLNIILLSKRF